MHRNEWKNVGALEPRAPLPQFARPIYQLHVRGRQPGADLAAGRGPRPQLPQPHSRGHRLRAHLARRHQAHRAAQSADHQGPHALQAERAQRRVRPAHHPLKDAQPRTTCP